MTPRSLFALGVFLLSGFPLFGADLPGVAMGPDGRLVYTPDAAGNCVPDFSHAGYGGGGVKLPDLPVKVTLSPEPGDNHARIQAALDQVAALPADEKGFRGAVLLRRGTYEVGNPLVIETGGIVLRGEGDSEDGTVLVATFDRREVFIQVHGKGLYDLEPERLFADAFVPCGKSQIALADASGLAVGDHVLVQRYGTAEWISAIGMDRLPSNMRKGPDGQLYDSTKQWAPAYWEFYDRTITALEGNLVSLNAPLPSAFGGVAGRGSLSRYSFPGRISQVGLENFRAVSRWTKRTLEEIRQMGALPDTGLRDNITPKEGETFDDLRHANFFCVMDSVENAWARNLTLVDFYDMAIFVEKQGKSITIQDCTSLLPDPNFYRIYSYVGRSNFNLAGQMVFIQRCLGVNNRHTFCVHSRVGGPNVFLHCDARNAIASSETHHRWSTGVLFDSLGLKYPSSIQLINRGNAGSGHGWAGANSVIWNSVGGAINVQVPPTAFNLSVGCKGKTDPAVAKPEAPAYVSWGKPVPPGSLYLQQLRERCGEEAVRNIALDWQLKGP